MRAEEPVGHHIGREDRRTEVMTDYEVVERLPPARVIVGRMHHAANELQKASDCQLGRFAVEVAGEHLWAGKAAQASCRAIGDIDV